MKNSFEDQGLLPVWIKKIEEREKIRIIRMQGSLDAAAVAKLEDFVAKVRGQKGYEYKHILLDFAAVKAIDSSAVAALLKALRSYKQTHQKLAMVNLNETAQSMIQLAKVGHLFPSYGSEEQAIKDLETRF